MWDEKEGVKVHECNPFGQNGISCIPTTDLNGFTCRIFLLASCGRGEEAFSLTPLSRPVAWVIGLEPKYKERVNRARKRPMMGPATTQKYAALSQEKGASQIRNENVGTYGAES